VPSLDTRPAPLHLTSPRVLEVLGNRLELLVEAGDSPRASVVRYTVAPGFAAPPVLHHHVEDDVTMVVLDGTLVMTGTDGELVVGPGEVVQLPHGTPFAWRNGSATLPMTYLAVYAPGGFEAYFVAVADALAAGTPMGPELVGPLWARYGIAASEV
jgi:mannose-6-phosphate isomerase-like protein (cupin superfamily)